MSAPQHPRPPARRLDAVLAPTQAEDLAHCREQADRLMRWGQAAHGRAEEAEATARQLRRRVRDLTSAIEDALLDEFDGDARGRLQDALGEPS